MKKSFYLLLAIFLTSCQKQQMGEKRVVEQTVKIEKTEASPAKKEKVSVTANFIFIEGGTFFVVSMAETRLQFTSATESA